MAKLIGKGTKLYVLNKTTPAQWDPICFIELTQPEPEWGEVETTDSCTTGKVREFSPTLLDSGSLSFVGDYDNAAASKTIADDLQASFAAGESRDFRVDHEQFDTGERLEFSGFLKKFTKPKFEGLEENIKIMGEIRISGAITYEDIA